MARPILEARRRNVLPQQGTELKIKARIAPNSRCKHFFVAQKHIDCRKPNATGKFLGWIPGGGGDLWWIQHNETNDVGAYLYKEVTDVAQDSHNETE